MKNIWKSLLLGAAVSLGASCAHADKGFDIYTNSAAEEKSRSENNVIYRNGDLAIGFNIRSKEEEAPNYTMASKAAVNGGNSKLYVFAKPDSQETLVEGKIQHKIAANINATAGVGSSDLFYGGLEYGTLKPFGLGLAYVENNKDTEIRGEIWKYWENLGLFAGTLKFGNKFNTVVSTPTDSSFSARYFLITDYEKPVKPEFGKLVFGKSRPDYYGLSFRDSFFLLQDDGTFGSDPAMVQGSPMRYLIPPTAWLVQDFGGRIQHYTNGNSTDLELEALKYIENDLWLGIDTKISGGVQTLGINAGLTTDKIKLTLNLDKNKNGNNSVGFQMRSSF